MTPKVTCEEIAIMLGISESCVNKLLNKALYKMREEAERLGIKVEDCVE